MIVLLFKGKGHQVWQEWDEVVRAIGHVTLGKLAPRGWVDAKRRD